MVRLNGNGMPPVADSYHTVPLGAITFAKVAPGQKFCGLVITGALGFPKVTCTGVRVVLTQLPDCDAA
jgi:hypothetical protein